MSQLLPVNGTRMARMAREQFVIQLQAMLVPMGQAVRARFNELSQAVASPREMQERRDAMLEYERKGAAWLQGTAQAWQHAVAPPTATAQVRLEAMRLELVGEEVVERKIMSSRLALALSEKTTWDLNDLKVRMQHLDGEEQASTDILRPEALCLLLVEQWSGAGLSVEAWKLVQDVIQASLLEHVPKAFTETNQFLVKQGVMKDIDLSARVKRTSNSAPGSGSRERGGPPTQAPEADTGAAPLDGEPGGRGGGSGWDGAGSGGTRGGPGAQSRTGRSGSGAPSSGRAGGGSPAARFGGSGGSTADGGASVGGSPDGSEDEFGGFDDGHTGGGAAPSRAGSAGSAGGAGRGGVSGHGGPATGVQEETRLMTTSPPMARARARASGVLGQLKRLLSEKVAGFDSNPGAARPSPALAQALNQQSARTASTQLESAPGRPEPEMVYDDAAVQEVAVELRRRTGELKAKASTQSEKATIEIVALMFQSILAEERIPAAVRVWFARLQMPVLRVALAEPEFFGSLEHPARQLIDRMGSCVLGFDAATIGGSTLETEIKRVVQVIEQYPETGRRVFQLVYEEFQRFLSKFLSEKGPTQKLMSVAQQVEQKETMVIQYTIEMRSMLADIPVREEVREFLFKVWAEVLAIAAVKHGPQHEETLALKSAASELVWAASAKPNRAERSRVIQDLPKLLQRLRQGMSLINIEPAEQEAHIKAIGDTLADAFLSKTETIPQARIEHMAKRLRHLEDFVAADPATDVPLDIELIEMMLGVEASDIEVIADGGTKPTAAMTSWANELQLGTWFTLDHNGRNSQVQYVWQSERRQLHLFAAPGQRSYLVQAKRLAAYLQAGLLLPAEEEALTVRATRDALAKLDANPERLLQ